VNLIYTNFVTYTIMMELANLYQRALDFDFLSV